MGKAKAGSSGRGNSDAASKRASDKPLPGVRRQSSRSIGAKELPTKSRACAGCDLWLSGAVIAAMGKNFHKDCFKCAECACHLDEFFEVDGKPMCSDCFEDSHPTFKCAKCGEVLEGAYFRVGELCFHKDCFACASCDKSLSGGRYIEDLNKRILCEQCGAVKLSKKGSLKANRSKSRQSN